MAINVVSQLMGHSSTAVTEAIYLHDSAARHHDAVAVLVNPRAPRRPDLRVKQ